jgi:seryl-tRNA synthetase
MTEPHSPKTNINTWVTIFGFALTILTGAVAFGRASEQNDARMLAIETRQEEMQRQFEDAMVETRRVRPEVEVRLRALETYAAAARTENQELKSDMADLKETLRDFRVELREVATLLRETNGGAP